MLCLYFPSLIFAQSEHNIWYFGQYAGVDFNSGTPTALTDGAMFSTEGCASVCDSSGNLLFYTNGMEIWNRNHTTMPMGVGLMGHDNSTQSSLIVQKPGSDSLYYVFTVYLQGYPLGLRYSVVDMSLDGALGDVNDLRNELIVAPVAEKVIAIQHANNEDYWIVTHLFNSSSFHAYLLTKNGLSLTPVVSTTGTYYSQSDYQGAMKASPDRKWLALANSGPSNELQLSHFNDLTGNVSGAIQLTGFKWGSVYGVEFSPNSQLLYASENAYVPEDKIYQFNLYPSNGASIQNTMSVIGSTAGCGALQLGPDNRIYHARKGESYLGVIDIPNEPGWGCNYIEDAIYLGGKFCEYGLPLKVYDSVIVYENDELIIPTAITPNSDGENDTWELSELDSKYPNNVVKIYNRLGNLIYESNEGDYENNEWDGTYNDELLPVGSYYYMILTNDDYGNQFTGAVSIIR